MTWYDVHNPGEYGWYHNQLFAFSEADSMDPPITLIWGDSFETAYEVYEGEAATSHTWKEVREIWDDIDWDAVEAGDEQMPDYFHFNDKGDVVHTEAIQGWEVDLNSPEYLMAVLLSIHKEGELELYAATFDTSDDVGATRAVERLQAQGYDGVVLVDWNFFSGREKDIEAITGGRLRPETRYVVWYIVDEERDEAVDPAQFYELAHGRTIPSHMVEDLDEALLDYFQEAFQVPPFNGAALFFFPGTEDELNALAVPGIDPWFDPLKDSRPGGGAYPRSGRYVWTRDSTVKLDSDAFEGQEGIVREVVIDLDEDLDDFMVIQDQLMSAGVDGFIAMWPPKDGRVWEGYGWKVLRGQEELDRAERFYISPSPEKVRYILQNPARKRKLKNRLLR